MTQALRIGIRMPPCRPVPALADFAVAVEDAGFDAIFVPDSQTLWRDAFLTLYAVAQRTSRLNLTTAVSNIVTRHSSVVAGLARTLDEVAPGRLTLGIGVGDSSVEPVGLRPSTGAELRKGVDQVRRLVRGEDVEFDLAVARLRDPRPAGVPIHVAATGPRNLRLAGEIADGVILLSGVAAGPLGRAVAAVREGAEATGRRFEDLEITVSAHALVTDDIERDARIIKPIVAAIAQRGGASALETAGIDVSVPAHVPEVLPDLVHAEDWENAVDVCSRWISDADAVAYARMFALIGSPAEIAERIRATRDLGATGVFLQHVGSWDLPRTLVETVGAEVLPALAGSRLT